MKIKELIDKVDQNVPNSFSKETKVRWIAQLDGKIALNVMLMDISETERLQYRLPEALDQEPLVPFPHDDLYELWLTAMIHAQNGETEQYQNTLLLYNAAYKDYSRWFNHTYAPAQDESTAITYYITAYGLAVQQGYSGSLDEWLKSLIGPKGDPGKTAYEYAVEGGYQGTEEAFKQYLLQHGVESDTTLSIEGGFADAKVTGQKFVKLQRRDAELAKSIETLQKKDTSFDEALKTVNTTLEKTNVSTYTTPEAFGCTAESTPAEIREKLPNGSIFLSLPEQLTNEGWNFPAEMGLVQMMKGIALDEDGNSARVKMLFYGKGFSNGDWQAVTDNSGTPTGEWYRMPRLITKTVTLTTDGWEGESAPYTQTIEMAEITTDGKVDVTPVWPDTQEGDLALQEACSLITHAKRSAGKITFTCREFKPTIDISIEVEVLV